MASRQYDIGTLVEVVYDPLDKLPNIAAKKFDGTQHRITSRKEYGPYGIQFTLDGCESDMGVPYVFTMNDLKIV